MTLLNQGREAVEGRGVSGQQQEEDWLVFLSNVFPFTYGPCFSLYTENLRGDPWPAFSDWHDFGCLSLSSEWPHVPWSSRVTSREQQINPMCQSWHDTMFSRALVEMFSSFLPSYVWSFGWFFKKRPLFRVYGVWLIFLPLTALVHCCWNHFSFTSPPFSLLFHIFLLPLGQGPASDLPSRQPFLCVCLPAVKDVSVQLSQIMFACPAVKTGGCPFHSTSQTTKGERREGGFNSHVWTQAIISNYCFSFQFSSSDGGPTRRTCHNPLQSSRISGLSESEPGAGTLWLSSQCESGVDSNMQWWEN